MVVVLVFIAFVALVALLTWRGTGDRVRITTCCAARPWPPDDLTRDAVAGTRDAPPENVVAAAARSSAERV